MVRCIIHIGMHKTGSTSIQKSLQGFEDAEFFYACIGDSGNHSVALFSMFSDQPERHPLNRGRAADPDVMNAYVSRVRADLEKSIDAAADRALIISGEDIGRLKQSELKSLRDSLRTKYDEIKIVGYIRPPKSYIVSAFQQLVRSGGHANFALERIYRNYKKRFLKFDRVFERRNVTLKLFDRQELRSGDVVVDFCSTIGVNLPQSRIRHANESVSRDIVCFLYQYNKYCAAHSLEPLRGRQVYHLLQWLSPFVDSKFRISSTLLEPIVDAQREDVAWMEERLGKSLHEPVPKPEEGDIRSEQDLLSPVLGVRVSLFHVASLFKIPLRQDISDTEIFHRLREISSDRRMLARLKRLRVRARLSGEKFFRSWHKKAGNSTIKQQ